MPIDTLAPSDGASILEGEVRELVRRRGIDPARDRAGLERLVAEALTDYSERASLGVVPALPDPHAAARSVVDALAGLGPLQRYLDDPEVEEIWINGPSRARKLLLEQGRPSCSSPRVGRASPIGWRQVQCRVPEATPPGRAAP